jgi:hypothetical protein
VHAPEQVRPRRLTRSERAKAAREATDGLPAGAVWSRQALYETMMIINLFGTILMALLAFAKLARNDLARYESSAKSTEDRAEAAA